MVTYASRIQTDFIGAHYGSKHINFAKPELYIV